MSSLQQQNSTVPRQPRGTVLLILSVLIITTIGLVWHFHHAANPTGVKVADNKSAPDATSSSSPQKGSGAGKSTLVEDQAGGGGFDSMTSQATSLEEKIKAIIVEKDLHKRSELIAALADQIAPAEMAATLDNLKKIPGSQAVSLGLLRSWAQTNAQAAAQWASQLPQSGNPEDTLPAEALKTVAINWADQNFKDAEQWAEQLPDSDGKNAALLALANEAVRSDPMEALRLAVNLPASASGDQLIQHAAMEWASKDPTAARDWGMQITDPDLRNQILSSVATAWSESNPEAAATMAVQDISGQAQNNAVMAIIQRWAQRDPQQVATWVKQFPDGQLKQAAIANLIALGIAVKQPG